MTKIKLCGLSRPQDIQAANELRADYIGFVFAPGSRRYVSPRQALTLKSLLSPQIHAVGVFVYEEIEKVARLLNSGVIDMAQLHGGEDEDYIRRLRGSPESRSSRRFVLRRIGTSCAPRAALQTTSC